MSIGVGAGGCTGVGDVALMKLVIDSSDTKFAIGAAVENCRGDGVLVLENGVGLKDD